MNFDNLQKKVYGQVQHQSALIVREKLNEETRTVPIKFSTETPILHWFGYCILSHDAGCADFTRLNNNGPLLKDHDQTIQIGNTLNAEIDPADKSGRCDIRYSKNHPDGIIEYQEMIDGVRTKVSVGFQIRKLVPENMPDGKQLMIDGIPVYRAILWEACEVSTVAMEADVNTGINRSMDAEMLDDDVIKQIFKRMEEIKNNSQTNPKGNTDMLHNRKHVFMEETPGGAPGGAATQVNEIEVRTKEMNRINAIDATLKLVQHVPQAQEIRNKAVNDGWTADKFANEVLPMVATRQTEVKPNQTGIESLGLTMKDVRQFSLRRAIEQLTKNGVLAGIENEVNNHILKFEGRAAKNLTVTVPVEMLMRDLSASTFGSGGATVATDLLSSEMIELQRNKTVVEKAGARILSGLVGNVAIPKATGGATAYWLAEGDDGNTSDQSFGQVGMTPRRLFGATAFTKQLVFQSGIGIESFIMNDIQTVLRIAKDLAALNGAGAAGEPLGILNMTGLATSVTFSGAATFPKMIEFETNVATLNADEGSLAYITSPGVRGKLKGVQMGTNLPMIWQKGMVNDYPAFVTNQIPSNKVVFGNWNDLVIGEWAGVDITVDPYTLAGSGKIKILIEMHCDIVARHTASFCKSTDAGNQ